jgi:hypothetical protein
VMAHHQPFDRIPDAVVEGSECSSEVAHRRTRVRALVPVAGWVKQLLAVTVPTLIAVRRKVNKTFPLS